MKKNNWNIPENPKINIIKREPPIVIKNHLKDFKYISLLKEYKYFENKYRENIKNKENKNANMLWRLKREVLVLNCWSISLNSSSKKVLSTIGVKTVNIKKNKDKINNQTDFLFEKSYFL